jgi:hypothetical protein
MFTLADRSRTALQLRGALEGGDARVSVNPMAYTQKTWGPYPMTVLDWHDG